MLPEVESETLPWSFTICRRRAVRRLPSGRGLVEAWVMPRPTSSASVLSLLAACAVWVLALLAVSGPAHAGEGPETYLVESWSREQGLPQSAVSSLLQTGDGYVWAGTFNGLARFDGVRFAVFDAATSSGLASSRITALFDSGDGSLWVGHEGGELSRMKGGMFEIVAVPGGLAAGITDIAAAPDGDVWIIRQDGTIQRVRDGRRFEVPKTEEPPFPALAFCRDRERRLWAVCGQFLRLLEEESPRSIKIPDSGEGTWYPRAAAAKAGGLWLAGKGNVRRWQDGAYVQDLGPGPWGDGTVTALLETTKGALAVGTIDRGLFILWPDGSMRHVSRAEGLTHDWVRSLAEDREGTLWVGTGGGGLCAVKPRRVQMLPPPAGWAGRNVLTIAADGEGGCWVGTEGDGLFHWRGGWRGRVAEADGLSNLFIWSAMVEPSGTLWAGSWGSGIFRNEPGGFRHPAGLDWLTTPVTALHRTRSGTVWIGAAEGLFRWRGGVAESISGSNLTGGSDVRVIMESADGSIWCGLAGGGLVRWKDGVLRQWRRTDGLPSDSVWSLSEDADGTIWIGTFGGGMARLRGDAVQAIIPAEGWPNRVICHIADDGAGYLWCATYGGIFRASKKSLHDIADGKEMAAELLTFGRAEGLEALECSGGFSPSGWRAPDGRLWFPTSRGIAIVDPKGVATNTVVPPVVIEEFHAGGRRIGFNLGEAMEFGPGRERIEIAFTALSFVAPRKVRFRYRLEGLDSGWTELGAERRVALAAVPPGRYVFRVTACNNDGVWNETGASVAFRIRPHVWQTGWFIGTSSFAALGLVAGSVRWVTRRRFRRRMEQLERQRAVDRERVRIAKDIHDDLGASLTRITLLSQSVRGEPGLPDAAGGDIDSIYATARELTRSMDEIVWAVNPRHDTLDSLVNYLGKFAQDFLSTGGIRCRLDAPVELPPIPVSAEIRHNLFLAFKEALNNVVRHSHASEVRIAFAPDAGRLRVAVVDNGSGPDALGDPSASRPGGGNGVPNMRRRMEEVGGAFEIGPAAGSGTRVAFDVPLKGEGAPR